MPPHALLIIFREKNSPLCPYPICRLAVALVFLGWDTSPFCSTAKMQKSKEKTTPTDKIIDKMYRGGV
jgi:hypothetical protein